MKRVTMDIDRLNQLPVLEARDALTRCCGAARWVDGMLSRRPFRDAPDLFDQADRVWQALGPQDWLEAFTHHPRIGDLASLRAKFASTAQWASGEQAGVQSADEAVLEALAEGNRAYEAKFGYIFIVCATGKSAAEMLAILQSRLPNHPELELRIAAGEQAKITKIRLEKLLSA
jgi:2-oxo-4-hydroxy-4-carboxy-5-ureidoimidazoline decarboxylase